MKNGAAEVSLVKLLKNHVSVAKEGEVFEQKITAASFFRVHEQPKMTCTILYTSWALTGQKGFFWNTLLATLLNSEQPTGLPLGFQKLPTESADIKMH